MPLHSPLHTCLHARCHDCVRSLAVAHTVYFYHSAVHYAFVVTFVDYILQFYLALFWLPFWILLRCYHALHRHCRTHHRTHAFTLYHTFARSPHTLPHLLHTHLRHRLFYTARPTLTGLYPTTLHYRYLRFVLAPLRSPFVTSWIAIFCPAHRCRVRLLLRLLHTGCLYTTTLGPGPLCYAVYYHYYRVVTYGCCGYCLPHRRTVHAVIVTFYAYLRYV